MRVKKIMQMGIMLAGLATAPVMAQGTYPNAGGSTTTPAPTMPDNNYGQNRDNRHFDFGWLGLVGLFGLLGLRRHQNRIDTTDTRNRL